MLQETSSHSRKRSTWGTASSAWHPYLWAESSVCPKLPRLLCLLSPPGAHPPTSKAPVGLPVWPLAIVLWEPAIQSIFTLSVPIPPHSVQPRSSVYTLPKSNAPGRSEPTRPQGQSQSLPPLENPSWPFRLRKMSPPSTLVQHNIIILEKCLCVFYYFISVLLLSFN